MSLKFVYTSLNVFCTLNPIQPSVALHIETSYLFRKTNDWFLYEMQHWAEMGKSNEKMLYFVMSLNHFLSNEYYF